MAGLPLGCIALTDDLYFYMAEPGFQPPTDAQAVYFTVDR